VAAAVLFSTGACVDPTTVRALESLSI